MRFAQEDGEFDENLFVDKTESLSMQKNHL